MRSFAILISIPIAALAAGCAKTDPVDENAVAPGVDLTAPVAANSLAPVNAGAAEAMRNAALPPASDPLGWTYNQQDRMAVFGPASAPALTVQCQKPREGEAQLIFVRYIPPSTGAQATLSFTGNGQAASLPVSSVSNPGGLGGHWRAAVPPNDSARDISEIFAGSGPIEVSVSGTPPLVVTSTEEPRRVFADCLSG